VAPLRPAGRLFHLAASTVTRATNKRQQIGVGETNHQKKIEERFRIFFFFLIISQTNKQESTPLGAPWAAGSCIEQIDLTLHQYIHGSIEN
jgi:hypothetical protein